MCRVPTNSTCRELALAKAPATLAARWESKGSAIGLQDPLEAACSLRVSRAQYARRSGARIDVLARNAPVRGEREDVDALPFEPPTVVRMHGTRGPLTHGEVIAAAQAAALEAQRRPAREDRVDVCAHGRRAGRALAGR